MITDAIILNGDSADCPQLIPLVETTHNNGFTMDEISADKAYSSRDNLDCIDKVGAVPYIPFKVNATAKPKGSIMWKKMYHYFQLNQEEFLTHYHSRPNVESTFMVVKFKLGDCIKSKNFIAQVNEVYCKRIAYNITVLISAMYELKVEPNLLAIN